MDRTLGEIKAAERDRISGGNEQPRVLEKMADAQHAIWAHWMKYMLSVCVDNHGGSVTIPADKVERWTKQMNTRYLDLSEPEKQSDRDIVKQFMRYELAMLEIEIEMGSRRG